MTDRRPPDVSVHDWQHQLIRMRHDEWRSTPKTEAKRIYRRELAKKMMWTLVGHMKRFHDPDVTVLRSYDSLMAYHEEFHANDE